MQFRSGSVENMLLASDDHAHLFSEPCLRHGERLRVPDALLAGQSLT